MDIEHAIRLKNPTQGRSTRNEGLTSCSRTYKLCILSNLA